MEKVLILSAVLFGMSEVLAVCSLLHTDWLNSGKEIGGIRLGLVWQCYTLHENTCFISNNLLPEWNLSIFFLTLGILLIALTFAFILASKCRRILLQYARRLAFISIGCLCFVGVLFPIGFRHPDIGGTAFNLPDIWDVGNSYKILWLSSLIFTSLGWSSLMIQLRVWIVAV